MVDRPSRPVPASPPGPVRDLRDGCPPTSAPPPAAAPVVAFEQAGVTLGSRTLWSDVDLRVWPGEFVAILGPNGAGKSTLLKAILGLVPLSAGRVVLVGEGARRGSNAIGYLPQRRSFDVDTRVRGRDLVTLGLNGTRWGFPLPGVRRLWGGSVTAREESRRVEEVIDLVDAARYADRAIGELSGGEQQRLLIAQSLVTRPRLLLLDEPLDGLDLNSQHAVSALIHRISADFGVAVLLVAHDVNVILPYLDRVVYIARGQVVTGTPEECMTEEILSRLYDTPIEILRTRDGRIVVIGQPEGLSYHQYHVDADGPGAF